MSRHQRTSIGPITATLTYEEAYFLLAELCIKLGFCLPPKEHERLANAPPNDIDQFTQAVFVAEGLGPVTSGDLYEGVRHYVSKAFWKHHFKARQIEESDYLAFLEEINTSRQAKAEARSARRIFGHKS